MSRKTREEVLARLRDRYAWAGRIHKSKIIDEVVDLFDYHRKAAIGALGPRQLSGLYVRGRPKTYDPQKLLPVLKTIWLQAMQPCGLRLKAALPEWLAAYQQDHHPIDSDRPRQLLEVSRATLDRLLKPARVSARSRTRPGTLLGQQIPIRTEWTEDQPGFLEMDTVALCGGSLDDCHSWMFDGVDIHTTWNELRALPNRSQAATLAQIKDVEEHLPFPLQGMDSDNGGEFINHHLVRYLQQRSKPVGLTRSRPYRKNDNAHIEQKNYTQVRLWFGYERYDNPEVVPLINLLCKGALKQFINFYLPTMKLKSRRPEGSKVIRIYDTARTPLSRVLDCRQVSKNTKARLRKEKGQLNPFQLRRDIDKQMKQIEQQRQLPQA